MARVEVLVTGFEPFLDVALNPSGELARLLDGQRIEAAKSVSIDVLGRVLPVAYQDAPRAFDAALDACAAPPALVLCLGVHRGQEFRLELRAGKRFGSEKPDNEGQFGTTVPLDGPEWRRSPLDVEGVCVRALERAGAPKIVVSEDAGGFLCERVYRAALDRGDALGIPALFLHVPPADTLAVASQLEVVTGLLRSLVEAST